MKGYLIEYNWMEVHGFSTPAIDIHTSYYWAYNNKELTTRRQLLEKAFQWKDNDEKIRSGKFRKWLRMPVSYRIEVVEL